jgi:K+-transporting ATPase KdpF subunit
MKTKILASFFPLVAVPVQSGTEVESGSVSYLIGGFVSILLMGYLIFTLLHPEKF